MTTDPRELDPVELVNEITPVLKKFEESDKEEVNIREIYETAGWSYDPPEDPTGIQVYDAAVTHAVSTIQETDSGIDLFAVDSGRWEFR